MNTLPRPIREAFALIGLIRMMNETLPVKRNAVPRGNDAWPELDAFIAGIQSGNIAMIPIDWDQPTDQQPSKVNLCICTECGGAFGKAFAKYIGEVPVCRECYRKHHESNGNANGAD